MKFTALAALVAVASLSSGANAALLQFDITGGYTASFAIDSNAIPDAFDDGSATFYDVKGTYENGDDNLADAQFFTLGSGGGLELSDYLETGSVFLFGGFGDQLFTGTTDHPVFRTGKFALFQDDPNAPAEFKIATAGVDPIAFVTISNAVPEPATWATMIGGVGMAGGMLRLRRNVKVRIAYA